MDKELLRKDLTEVVTAYVAMPDAYDDACVTIDTLTGNVGIAEEEETDSLPDTTDIYFIMDFVEMTPEGNWVIDNAAIDAAADDYFA